MKQLCLGLICLTACTHAAADTEGILVLGNGEVLAKPNRVEFRVRVSGAGELASDALVKYLDHRRRTLAALEQLKLKALKTESRGISVSYADSQADSEVPGASIAQASLQFSSVLRLAVDGICELPEDRILETVSQLVDKLRDLDVQLIPSGEEGNLMAGESDSGPGQPIVLFVLGNATELREQAYQKAFAAARHNAERLAKLAGVKIGPVLAITDLQFQDYADPTAAGLGDVRTSEAGPTRMASNKFATVPVRVNLQVRFGIQK